MDFTDKVVIITGAGGSLGKAYALEFGKRGAHVVVNDLGTTHNGSSVGLLWANATVAEIKFNGGKAILNFDNVECGDKIVEAAIKHFGRVDVIINNAGILLDKSFENMSDNDWDMVYRTHVKGSFSVTKAAWPFFKKQKYGRIIFISSNSAIYGNFGQANYAAAKNALIGLSHTLAIEGSKYNIQSNVVIPTASSRLTAQIFAEEDLQALKPEYVVPLVVYLGHESCQESGKIFEAGAGWYGQIQSYRSKGMILPYANAETIAEHWAAITDMSSASHFDSIQEVTADLLSCAGKKKMSSLKWEPDNEKKDEYMKFFQLVAYYLNKMRGNRLKSRFVVMLMLTNGVDVYNFTESFGGNEVVPDQPELVCVIMMHCDLYEQVLSNKFLRKEAIKSRKLVVVGDINEENVLKCFNYLVSLSRPKL